MMLARSRAQGVALVLRHHTARQLAIVNQSSRPAAVLA